MKTKVIFAVGLLLQVGLLVFVLMLAPDTHGGIRVGLEKLKENCPTQAPTITPTSSEVLILKTAGDFSIWQTVDFNC